MDELVRRAQAGDVEAMEAVWTKVERFAYAITRRYTPTTTVSADDLRQCAFLGTHTAVMKYTGNRPLLSLILSHVRRECRRTLGLERKTPTPNLCSLDTLCTDGETPFAEMFPDESIPENDEAIFQAQLCQHVREAVAALPEREQCIVATHYFQGLSFAAMAQETGVTSWRIEHIEADAFRKLRKNQRLREDYAVIRSPSSGQSSKGRNPTERQALTRIEREKRQALTAWVHERLACGAISEETARRLLP